VAYFEKSATQTNGRSARSVGRTQITQKLCDKSGPQR